MDRMATSSNHRSTCSRTMIRLPSRLLQPSRSFPLTQVIPPRKVALIRTWYQTMTRDTSTRTVWLTTYLKATTNWRHPRSTIVRIAPLTTSSSCPKTQHWLSRGSITESRPFNRTCSSLWTESRETGEECSQGPLQSGQAPAREEAIRDTQPKRAWRCLQSYHSSYSWTILASGTTTTRYRETKLWSLRASCSSRHGSKSSTNFPIATRTSKSTSRTSMKW